MLCIVILKALPETLTKLVISKVQITLLNIFTLGSSPFNDMVGCMLLQRSVISLQVVTLTNFHLQYGNAYIKPDSIDVLQDVS